MERVCRASKSSLDSKLQQKVRRSESQGSLFWMSKIFKPAGPVEPVLEEIMSLQSATQDLLKKIKS